MGLTRRAAGTLVVLGLGWGGMAQRSGQGDWPTYGGDAGGQRYSALRQINTRTVKALERAWVTHTGSMQSPMTSRRLQDFEATPVLFEGRLVLTTPFDVVLALDPVTGRELWRYDPGLPVDLLAANYTSRGVATWSAKGRAHEGLCGQRVFVATLDARLLALDGTTGRPCADFGQGGQVDLRRGVATRAEAPYRMFGNTSPATVVGDVVVVGSAVADNQAVEAEAGLVRGFDARTGRQLWSFDPTPWANGAAVRTGGSNTWAVMAADPARDLLFLPTGSPSPDFWGGLRPGEDRDANSVVALRASTGEKVWSFQLIHHDLWDYDVAAEPLLFDFRGARGTVTPAVAVVAKPGMVFVLDRRTGRPLLPVEERAVPASDVPGNPAWPTQPFSSIALNPLRMDPAGLAGHTAADAAECTRKLEHLRYDGVFTPPSLRGTLQYPGSLGGVNWSSMAIDPRAGLLLANVNGSAYEIRLVPRGGHTPAGSGWRAWLPPLLWGAATVVFAAGVVRRRRVWPGAAAAAGVVVLVTAGLVVDNLDRLGHGREGVPGTSEKLLNSPDAVGETSPQTGAPYQIFRKVLTDSRERPCTPTPWGSTVAVDLNGGGREMWRRPLGSVLPANEPATGTNNFGAPVVTAGGVVVTAGSREPKIEAYDERTGELLWTGALPVPAQSTPMTYMAGGRQFVVIAAGGHGGIGTPLGDAVVAFALPEGKSRGQ